LPPARGRALHGEALFTHCDHGAGQRAAQALASSALSPHQPLVQSLQLSELDRPFVADMADGAPKESQSEFGGNIEKFVPTKDDRSLH
jgi:hypothetical protein